MRAPEKIGRRNGDIGSVFGPTTGLLLGNLAAAGIDRKSIDTILISHFHPDHISGIRSKSGAANFPNAEVMVSNPKWAYWTDAGEANRAPEIWKPAVYFRLDRAKKAQTCNPVRQVA